MILFIFHLLECNINKNDRRYVLEENEEKL